MKGLILVLAAVFSYGASAQLMINQCRSSNGREILRYDGVQFERVVLDGVKIGQPEAIAIRSSQSVQCRNSYEQCFRYDLANGLSLLLTWTADPRGAEMIDPSFRSRVVRMELSRQGALLDVYENCEVAIR